MGLFDRLRGGDVHPERTITVDRDIRRGQLLQLESSVLDLMDAIRAHRGFVSPGWQARHEEYQQVARQAAELRARDFDWVEVSDLAHTVRPMLKDDHEDDQASIWAAQSRMLELATALLTPLASELS